MKCSALHALHPACMSRRPQWLSPACPTCPTPCMHEQEAAVAGTLEGEENQEEKVPIQVKLCWHLTNLGKHMPAL